MSIIVYRDGVMAADTAVHIEGTYVDMTEKIWSVGAELVGVTGHVSLASVVVEWVKKGALAHEQPALDGDDDFEVVRVGRDSGVNWCDRYFIWNQWRGRYYASGSGAQVALGALEHGASAQDAVEVACRISAMCREPITVLRLEKQT